jgi:hypothetical protein
MERAATVARTNLADNETNVNRLRVPQFGIVALKLSVGGKESKTYLQPGAAPVAGAGTDDFHFVPDKESITIAYEIDDAGAIVDEGKVELFTRFKEDPLWTLDLEKLGAGWLGHGKHEVKWDGRVVKSAEAAAKIAGGTTTHDLTALSPKQSDEFPDGYVTLEHSPYKLKLTLKSEVLPKKAVVAWTYFQIVLKKIEMEVGPEEAIPKAFFGGDKLKMDKHVRTRVIGGNATLANADPIRQVSLVSNIFKTDSSQMDDNTAFDLYEKLWGEGPNIPVFAKIRLADSSDAEVKLESDKGAVALGNTRFLWEWEDANEIARNAAGSNPETFVTAAVDYYKAGTDARSASKDHTYPTGDNCHVDRGGKRGPDAKPIFPEQSGYKPKTALDAGDFPFKVEACKERKWSAFSTAWGKGKLAGQTGVVFQPSRMAGDDYKLRVYLAWDHDNKGKVALDVKTEPLNTTVAGNIQASTGQFQVWRELHIVRYVRKLITVADFIAGRKVAIQDHYKLAYIDVDFTRLAAKDSYVLGDHRLKNGDPLDYNKLCRDALDGSGTGLFTEHLSVDSTANHAANEAMFVVRHYDEFVNRLHLYLDPAGAGDIAAAAAAAGVAPDAFARSLGNTAAAVVATWPATAMYNRLKATRSQLRTSKLHTEDVYSHTLSLALPSEPVLNKFKLLSGHQNGFSDEAADGISIIHFNHIHTVVLDCIAHGGNPRRLNGMAYDPGDATHERCAFVLWENRVDTFVHEIGHHLFLPHSPFPAADPPDGARPERHDVIDDECIMSYNGARKVFCGLCQLRLRGWSAKALDKTGGNNKKP